MGGKAILMPRNEALRKESGEFDSADPLVDFLYVLMRDKVTPGDVEKMVTEQETFDIKPNKSEYTNGWLARYAKHIAKRIRDLSGSPVANGGPS